MLRQNWRRACGGGRCHSALRCVVLFLCVMLAANVEASSGIALTLDEARGELKAHFKSRPLLAYAFATNQFKPYVRELYSLTGVNVLRDAPADHLHHHGLMYAIRVNGVNFWEEHGQPGIQKPVRLLNRSSGYDSRRRPRARFTHLIHWVSSAEASPLLIERRTLTVTIDEVIGEVALRWQGAFEVGRGTESIKLHGSAYNGLGLRLPQAFDHVARHMNSASAPYTPEQKWDVTAATWSAVSHTVEGRDVMVALFNGSSNKGAPRFFTMLNPFAYLSVTQNLEDHPLEYTARNSFAVDYLLAVYSEKKSSQFLNERLQRWEKESYE